MDDTLWEIKKNDILSIDTQVNPVTQKDFASVKFRYLGLDRFAVIQLKEKPGDMELKDWCAAVLNTHYLVKKKEKERDSKLLV